MDKYLLLLFSLIILNSDAQICNNRIDFNSRPDNGGNVIQTDTGFIVTSFHSDTGYISLMALTYYNTNCAITFQRYYSIPYHHMSYGGKSSIQRMANGDFIVFVNLVDSTYENHPYLMRFQSNGDTIFTKKIIFNSSITYGRITDVCRTNDGKFVITGLKDPYYDAYLAKIDTMGNQIWLKHYATYDRKTPEKVMQTADNGFIISGNFIDIGNSSVNKIFALKTDSLGNQTWVKFYGNPLANYNSGFINHQFPDGSYLIAGNYSYSNGRALSAYRISYNGTLIWRKEFSSINGMCFSSFAQGINDTVVVIGAYKNINPLNGSTVSLITKVDMNGHFFQERTYQVTSMSPNLNSMSNGIICNDGSYAFVGTVHDGQQDAWFVHTDRHGCVVPDCWQIEQPFTPLPYNDDYGKDTSMYFDHTISIYPNPANAIITFNIGEDVSGYLSIANAAGQEIKKIKFERGIHVLDSRQFSSGIYILYGNIGEFSFRKKFIITNQ